MSSVKKGPPGPIQMNAKGASPPVTEMEIEPSQLPLQVALVTAPSMPISAGWVMATDSVSVQPFVSVTVTV